LVVPGLSPGFPPVAVMYTSVDADEQSLLNTSAVKIFAQPVTVE
jgi:hypothetical protein